MKALLYMAIGATVAVWVMDPEVLANMLRSMSDFVGQGSEAGGDFIEGFKGEWNAPAK